jgi:acetyl esterase/lipase
MPWRRTAQWSLSAVTILLAGFALAAVLLIVIPPFSIGMWQLGLLASEFSLVVALTAAVAALLTVPLYRRGAHKFAFITGVISLVSLCGALIPPFSAWRTASHQHVHLSISEYFAGLSTSTGRTPSIERYGSADGKGLYADIWRPRTPAAGRRPAVIMVHGGATSDVPRSSTPRWDTWLNERGYVVFDIDYRFFPPAQWWLPPGDVKCALGWVHRNAARFGVDEDHIALMGQSAGGYLSLLVAYTAGNPAVPPTCAVPTTPVRAVVALYSPADWSYSYRQGPSWRVSPTFVSDAHQELRRMLGGTPDARARDYRMASPINHVRRDSPPTLLVQGGRDALQPAGDTLRLDRRLGEVGAVHRLVEIPYADHFFDISWGGFGSQITRPAVADFLRRHL